MTQGWTEGALFQYPIVEVLDGGVTTWRHNTGLLTLQDAAYDYAAFKGIQPEDARSVLVRQIMEGNPGVWEQHQVPYVLPPEPEHLDWNQGWPPNPSPHVHLVDLSTQVSFSAPNPWGWTPERCVADYWVYELGGFLICEDRTPHQVKVRSASQNTFGEWTYLDLPPPE